MNKNSSYQRFKTPYSPYEKQKALKLLETSSIKFVCKRYHCARSTLFEWRKRYDGTLDSLANGSHRPKSKHPKSHTEEEKDNIKKLLKRNPNIGLTELYGKLVQQYGYKRNPVSLYRFLIKNGYFKQELKRNKYKPQKYETPINVGEKMQLDVKVVPYECRTKAVPFDKKFYQYTIIDEATRQRFIYAYDEQNGMNTIDFVMKAINYFGYVPKTIQTDNGQEFTIIRESKKKHIFDDLCEKLGIEHKLIKPRTPRHNGKVERSHRNDNERFYQYLKFFSLDDLNYQMKLYLKRSNNIPSSSLKWKTPLQKRQELELLGQVI